MAMAADVSSRTLAVPAQWQRCGAALTAGLVLAVCFPPYGWYLAMPGALAALLLVLDDATPRRGFYIGFSFGAAFFGVTTRWFFGLFGFAAVSLIAILAAFVGLFCALCIWLPRAYPRLPIWAVVPWMWVAVEYYRSEPFPLNFGWMGLGYGLVGCRGWMAVASCVGCYGVSACVMLLAWALAAGIRGSRPVWALGALVAWVAVCAVPAQRRAPERAFSVRLAQGTSPDADLLLGMSFPKQHRYAIVWPEYSLFQDPAIDTALWRQLGDVARKNHAVFVFGGEDGLRADDENRYRNTAYALGPDGEVRGKHVKNHLVHFFRDGIRGRTANPIATPLGRLGVAICFDMDFPDVARRLTQGGAEVLVVPSMDPQEWGPLQRRQHMMSFAMRAAECGRWLARADVAGGTAVWAPDGRLAAAVDTTEPTYLDADVGRTSSRTIYTVGGWLLGPLAFWSALGATVVGLARRWRERRRNRTALSA